MPDEFCVAVDCGAQPGFIAPKPRDGAEVAVHWCGGREMEVVVEEEVAGSFAGLDGYVARA